MSDCHPPQSPEVPAKDVSGRHSCGAAETEGRSIGRVTLVSQYYSPEPVLNPQWTALGLRDEGWRPAVLTGIPNYPTGVVEHGYDQRRTTESIDGIDVTRVPLIPNHGRRSLGRALNYLSWAILASTLGLSTIRQADVSLVYMTPATAALPAMVARRLLGRPYVLLVQDIWPDSIFASGFLTHPRLRRVVEFLLNGFVASAYRRASGVVATSPGMRNLLSQRGVPDEKLSLIYNWVDESIYRPHEADERFRLSLNLTKEDFVVMYAGNHGAAQGLETLVEAISHLPAEMRCHAVLIGDGVEKRDLQETAARIAPGRIHFLPPESPQRLASILPCGDIHLVTLIDKPLFHLTMPGKVQSLLAAGQPLLVSAPGDAARVVSAAEAGLTARPGDAVDLACQIEEACRLGSSELAAMAARGRNLYLADMSAKVGARRMSLLLENVRQEAADSRPDQDSSPARHPRDSESGKRSGIFNRQEGP